MKLAIALMMGMAGNVFAQAPKQEKKPPAEPPYWYGSNIGTAQLTTTAPSALVVMDHNVMRLRVNFHGPALIEIFDKDGNLQLSVNEAGVVTEGRDKLDAASIAFWESFARAERELVGKTPCSEPKPEPTK